MDNKLKTRIKKWNLYHANIVIRLSNKCQSAASSKKSVEDTLVLKQSPILKFGKIKNNTQTNGGKKMETITERDEKGHLTHERLSDGSERWYDYNADGKLTHVRLSNGSERWYDYDADGKLTHERWGDGTVRWYDYDADGNITKWKDK